MGNPDFTSAGRKIDEATRRVEEEVKRVVQHLNDEVVPKIRTQGSQALRVAAEQLSRLADKMDDKKKTAEKQP
ncbi:MAG TPA: hypothetical protein VFZ99_09050 [Terriglobales bacterium]